MKAHGFTLVEVLVALGLFVVIATGVAQLAAAATRGMRAARDQTMTVMLAATKMDQLRALEWTYEPSLPGDPLVDRSDATTDLTAASLGSGGVGLRPSPAGSLTSNLASFVDYCDDRGRWVGSGTSPPPDAVFIRRWAVRPLTVAPDRALLLQVLVVAVREERSRASPWSARSGGDALLISVRTRTRD